MRSTWKTWHLSHLLEFHGHLLSEYEFLGALAALAGQPPAHRSLTAKSRSATTDTASGTGRWITIGGREGKDGKRRGGSPVFVQDGRITKGAPSLAGKRLDNLRGESESTHRKDLNREKDYRRAKWSKRAKAEGISPADLHQLAAEMQAHDKEHVEQRKRLLRESRELLTKYGYSARALTTNLRSGHVEDNIPAIDLVARTMANRYPDQFADHPDDVERLTDLLTEGNPQPMSEDDAYEQALQHLQEYGGGGNRVSDRPLDDEEEEPWTSPFSRTAKSIALSPGDDRPLTRAELAVLEGYRADHPQRRRTGDGITRKSMTTSASSQPRLQFRCNSNRCWVMACADGVCRPVVDKWWLKWLEGLFQGVAPSRRR